MAFKVKGIFKGFKAISRIFAVKEQEMEIGYPTDVKHVAHIGWDSAASPSWMDDIMASSDLSSLSMGNFAASNVTSWVSQDLDQQPCGAQEPVGSVAGSTGREDSATCTDVPRPPRKARRRRPKDGAPSRPSTSAGEAAAPPSPAAHADVAANCTR